jgi:hypothetical protein
MTADMRAYVWNSYRAYFEYDNIFSALIDTAFILKMYGDNLDEARKYFKIFMETENDDPGLDDEQNKLSDEELRSEIIRILNGLPICTLHGMAKKERNNILRKALLLEGASARQIARVCGLNRGVLHRIKCDSDAVLQ